jgi:hypothetical protein
MKLLYAWYREFRKGGHSPRASLIIAHRMMQWTVEETQQVLGTAEIWNHLITSAVP